MPRNSLRDGPDGIPEEAWDRAMLGTSKPKPKRATSEVEEQIARAERESREGDREADYPAQRESEGGRGGRWNREGTEV